MRLLGVFNDDVDVTRAADFGRKLGSTVGEPFAVGCDARAGSLPMKVALSSGLLSAGCNVADLQFVPSPVLARVARQEDVWAVHLSADPYPSDYVGARVYDPSGKPWDGKLEPARGKWPGRLETLDLSPNYIADLLESHRLDPLKVVVDSANGPTGRVVPGLLRSLGVEVMEVDTSLAPRPSRGYEPSAGALGDLQFIVRRKRADLGVAFDGAGSKAAFVVPGSYISAGRAMALLMKFNGYDRAVADMGATSLLDLVGTIDRVPASEVTVAERLHARGYELGGGTMGVIFPDWSFAPDGIALMVELLATASRRGESVEELNGGLPENYEMADMVPDENAYGTVERVREQWREYELDLREGIKATMEGGWVWLQPMEGFVRVAVEADTRARARELLEAGKKAINPLPVA